MLFTGYTNGGMGGYGLAAMAGSGSLAAASSGPAEGGSSLDPSPVVLNLVAYIFDQEVDAGHSRIEIVTWPTAEQLAALNERGQQMAGGYGAGGFSGGMMLGGPQLEIIRLSSLVRGPKTPAGVGLLTADELQIVEKTIKLEIWIGDTIRQLQRERGASTQTQQRLQQLMTEAFQNQLARQELEVETILTRASQLKQEISRRRDAEQRVVDVQVERMVLEAQGLLGE